jgi:ribonuclease J
MIVMTGDFKFDWTPIGPLANIHKMAEIGKKDVKLLLSDSTNALIEGVSISESKVDEALSDIFRRCKGRIIIATFASNIYRLKHIIETCRENNRKVALFGRSMEMSIEIAIEGGYIAETDIFVTQEEANKIPNEEIALLCTGSQGEPLAALSRIANGSHRQIKLMKDDVVIFSSSPIPGNGVSIANTINQLYLKGVEVFTNTSLNEIHTSGHANKEELKLMLRLIQPKYFMPYHGEYRMLKAHKDIAIECGLLKKNIFVLENGQVLSMSRQEIKVVGEVPASDVYVDGSRIGGVGNIVIKDRIIMANDGILVIIANIDVNNRKLLGGSHITTRGFVLVNENEQLLSKLEGLANKIINNNIKDIKLTYNNLKSQIIQEISPYVWRETGRKPIILPVFMEIKRS